MAGFSSPIFVLWMRRMMGMVSIYTAWGDNLILFSLGGWISWDVSWKIYRNWNSGLPDYSCEAPRWQPVYHSSWGFLTDVARILFWQGIMVLWLEYGHYTHESRSTFLHRMHYIGSRWGDLVVYIGIRRVSEDLMECRNQQTCIDENGVLPYHIKHSTQMQTE